MPKIKHKILLGMFTVGVLYTIWMITRPVEIVGVHIDNFSEGYYSNYIIVKNFPVTDKGKISWWENNKFLLKEKYGVPKNYIDGRFSVKILDAGDGYKLNLPKRDVFFPDSDTSHLICFEEMKVAENCIDKNWVMDIEKIRDNRVFFSIGRSSYQQAVEGGKITKNDDL
ncbi:hypothetical protein BZ21_3175 [Yersinia pseudotuberculosis]|uniref:DUF943 family protein n=4 Tax=Yersinia pseudotuberculosis TaxID=633 RepID=UPI00017396CA|nr:DUF943 family protein [Yersinia pseudotuberculosis]CQD56550.1 entero membrane protein [Yersinia intermedia]AJJ03191.1 hypothetical protein BZ21_3175 [Yersinia pseudotuberculosis]AJJ68784.1 hypothetical protein BZ16_3288 [Yersinia pseudotuberculosis PB1/+]AJJ69489.1 hypothetical protein BZ23_3450 [Yersinia pseudotuberculosis]AYX16476.1 DUF943 family protein [Yersinia pseudotuberculosis]